MTKREETLEMAILYEKEGLTLEQIGKQYGISKQTISQRFAKIEILPPRRLPKCAQIDKTTLEHLYSEKRLSIDRISREFNTYPKMVYQALAFYEIPKRLSIQLNGKHKDTLKKLAIGEKIEIECHAKYPNAILHVSAKHLGIKISMKKLEKGRFEITRVV